MTQTYCDICREVIDPLNSFEMRICNTNIGRMRENKRYNLCNRCTRKVKKIMAVEQKKGEQSWKK